MKPIRFKPLSRGGFRFEYGLFLTLLTPNKLLVHSLAIICPSWRICVKFPSLFTVYSQPIHKMQLLPVHDLEQKRAGL